MTITQCRHGRARVRTKSYHFEIDYYFPPAYLQSMGNAESTRSRQFGAKRHGTAKLSLPVAAPPSDGHSKTWKLESRAASPTPEFSRVSQTLAGPAFPTRGISLEGIREFVERCGGAEALRGAATRDLLDRVMSLTLLDKDSYCACALGNLRPHSSDKAEPPHLAIRTKVEAASAASHQRETRAVGPATVFVSHAWGDSFLGMVDALERWEARRPGRDDPEASPTFFWIDLFANSQHGTADRPFEWWLGVFATSIARVGCTVLVLQNAARPVPLSRVWCLWEIAATACAIDEDEVGAATGGDRHEKKRAVRSLLLGDFGEGSADGASDAGDSDDAASDAGSEDSHATGVSGDSHASSGGMSQLTDGGGSIGSCIESRRDADTGSVGGSSGGSVHSAGGGSIELLAGNRGTSPVTGASSPIASLGASEDSGDAVAAAAALRLQIAMPGSEEAAFTDALVREPGTVMARLTAVDVRAAEASLPADRERIFAAIERRKGGVPGMEEGIVQALQRWMTAVAGAQLRRGGGDDEEGAAASAARRAVSPLQAAYAQFLLAQGRALEAEALLREACEAHAAAAGPHAPATLAAQEQRVRALCALRRRLPEAEALAREVVQARRAAAAAAATEEPRAPCNEHAAALPSALDALAHVLCERAAGQNGAPAARTAFDEAEALLREGLGLRRAALGERHGATLTAAHHLALLLAQQQGRLGEAEALARVVLEETRASLGAAHADSLSAAHNLGVILRAAAAATTAAAATSAVDATAAADVAASATTAATAAAGGPLDAAAVSSDAAAPLAASAAAPPAAPVAAPPAAPVAAPPSASVPALADEAAALLGEALRGRRKLLPRGHAVVLSSTHALASVHALRGAHDAALPLAREAFKGRRRALGSDHVDTLASGHQLASVLLEVARLSAPATSASPAAKAMSMRVPLFLDDDAPPARSSLGDHLAAAELVCKRVVSGRRRALGAEHLDALDSLHLYGLAKMRQRDSRAALAAFRRAWRGRVRALGAGAPQALASFAALADAVAQVGGIARGHPSSSGLSDVASLAKQLEPREAGEPGFGAARVCGPVHEVIARVATVLPLIYRSSSLVTSGSAEAGVLDSYALALVTEAEGRLDAAAKAYTSLIAELGSTEPPACAAALAVPGLSLRLPLQIRPRLALSLQRSHQPLQAAHVLHELAEDLRSEASAAEAREMRLHALVAVAELHTSSAEAHRELVAALWRHEPALPPSALIPHLLQLARLLCASPVSSNDLVAEAVDMYREALALMAQVEKEEQEVGCASDTAPAGGSGSGSSSGSSIPAVQLEMSRALARCGRVAEALPLMHDCVAAIAAGPDAARTAHAALLLIKAVEVVDSVAATGSFSPQDASIALDILHLAQATANAALRVIYTQTNDSALYTGTIGSSFLASCLRLSSVLRTAAAAITVAPAASAAALTAADGFDEKLEALARARRERAERVHGCMRYSPKTGECVVELAEVLAARRRFAPARAVFEEAVADSRHWPREAHTVPLLDRMQRGLAALTPG